MGAAKKLDEEIARYLHLLSERQKQAVLTVVKTFAEEDSTAEPSKMQPQSLEEYNKELDEALQRVSKGEYTTLEELEKEMKDW